MELFHDTLKYNESVEKAEDRLHLKYVTPLYMRLMLACISSIANVQMADKCSECPLAFICWEVMTFIEKYEGDIDGFRTAKRGRPVKARKEDSTEEKLKLLNDAKRLRKAGDIAARKAPKGQRADSVPVGWQIQLYIDRPPMPTINQYTPVS